jgi:hypothetical protein
MKMFLFENWAKMGILSAFFILTLLVFYPGSPYGSPVWLFWLHVPVYMLHQFEEYVYPGGFKERLNETLGSGGSEFPLNDERSFWINVPFVWMAMPLAAIIGLRVVIIPATLVAISTLNGLLHVGMGIRTKRYNPGFIASFFLNIPLGCFTFIRLFQSGGATLQALFIAAVLGLILHAMLMIYLIRTKRKPTPNVP